MRIDYSSSDLLTRETVDICNCNALLQKSIKEVLHDRGIAQPIKAEISKEGMELWKKMGQNNTRAEDIKDIIPVNICLTPDKMWTFENEGWPDIEDFIDFGNSPADLIGKRVSQDWWNPYVSVHEKSNMLLQAYTRAYNEIVNGYENGTRKKYVIDGNAENFYRPVTKEEELKILWKGYESWVDDLDAQRQRACDVRKINTEIDMQKAYKGTGSIEQAKKSHKLYIEMKMEEQMNNIRQMMLEAAKSKK